MGLAQYHMVDWDYGNTLDISRRTGNPLNMSSVYLEFTFKRRMGFFVLQVSMNHFAFKLLRLLEHVARTASCINF